MNNDISPDHFAKDDEIKPNISKFQFPVSISNITEAKEWLKYLHENCLAFHPDERAEDILNNESKPLFTPEEAVRANILMDAVCSFPDFDPCEYLFSLVITEL